MLAVLKPSGERDTASLDRRFWRARWQLTGIYVVILAIILFLSSSIIDSAFTSQFQHRFEPFRLRIQRTPTLLDDDLLVSFSPEDVHSDLVQSLLLVNGFLLSVAGVASYWLAGLTLDPIQEAYERQRRFLGDASHELRTPLAVLRTDLENASEETTSTVQRKQIDSYLEEVDRMGHLVADLLTLSRLDERPLPSERLVALDLRDIATKTRERFDALAKRQGIQLTVASLPASAVTVLGDHEWLMQALGNIVSNAILYNKPNGRVTISVDTHGNEGWMAVEDTGIGMAEKDIHKVFDRFYRVDKSRSRATGGSGLGLSIVHAIMDRLQGSVELKSALGEGTTVTLRLPLASPSSFLH